jgi:hypothetical protein
MQWNKNRLLRLRQPRIMLEQDMRAIGRAPQYEDKSHACSIRESGSGGTLAVRMQLTASASAVCRASAATTTGGSASETCQLAVVAYQNESAEAHHCPRVPLLHRVTHV